MSVQKETVILGSPGLLPTTVLRRLRSTPMAPDRILLAAEADLTPDGAVEPVWLVVSQRYVCGVPAESAGDITGPFAFDQVGGFDLWRTVGSTSLRAITGGVPTTLVRFTNEFRERFLRVLGQLKRLQKGLPLDREALLAPDPRLCPRCQMILDSPGGSCPRCVQHKAVLARVLSMLRPYAWWVLLLLALMCAGIALDLLPPYLMKSLVDKVLLPKGRPDLLWKIVLALVGAGLLRCGINLVVSWGSSRVGTDMTRNVRLELFRKLEDLSVAYYDRVQLGGLMTRVINDAEVLQGFVQQATQGLLVNIMLVVGIGVMMFCLSPRLAFYVIIPIPLIVVATMIFRKHIRSRHFRFRDSRSKLGGMLNGVLSGIRLVKAFGQEQREFDRFAGRAGHLADSVYAVELRVGAFQSVMAYVFMLPGFVIWYVGGREVLADADGVSLGTLMAFLGYLGMFYAPVQRLAFFSNWLTKFMTGTQRIFEILDTPAEITDRKNALPVPRVRGDVEFDNVTFGYDPYNPVIHDVSLGIRAGENIGIVGRSGSGKTTLVNLMCRFYDVQNGAVRIDGVDVRDLKRTELRSHIGLVLQEPFLFRASIAQNIAYGRSDATMGQIVAVARAANCHDFIMRLPQGYDTRLGEAGAGLSGGERQRMGIARALLCDPAVLILDEATSSVDTESEREIRRALETLSRGRTTVTIAHRLSTLRNADRIYVVDSGRIAECGSHAELMEKEGIYHRLVKIQTQLATVDAL